MRRIWRRLDEQHVVANGHQLATLHVRAESHRHLGDEVCANIWRRLQHCDKNAATSSRETNKQTKKKKKRKRTTGKKMSRAASVARISLQQIRKHKRQEAKQNVKHKLNRPLTFTTSLPTY